LIPHAQEERLTWVRGCSLALIWSVVPLTRSSSAVCAIHELQFVYSFGHCFLSDTCSFVMKFCYMWFFAFFTYRPCIPVSQQQKILSPNKNKCWWFCITEIQLYIFFCKLLCPSSMLGIIF
jgi:hypothetical protein